MRILDSERRLNIKYQLIVTCTMYVLYRSWTCSGLMVGILDSEWSHQGLSPGRSHSDCLCSWARHFTLTVQGPTLRLTCGQCDQKLSVGDQKFRTGRQQATNLLSPRHLKFQGKWAFFKRKHKAAVENCSKTKRRFYDRHNYPVPYCFIGFSQF